MITLNLTAQALSSKQRIEIPIRWNIPDNIITRFANHMLVQTLENEFKLSFFELKPEIRLTESDPLSKEVRADCVASIIVSAERLPKIIEALQSQFAKYNTNKQPKK